MNYLQHKATTKVSKWAILSVSMSSVAWTYPSHLYIPRVKSTN